MRVAISLLLLFGAIATTPAPTFPFDQAPYTKPQRLIDIGNGRRMNLYCVGSGSPTIVLEGGFGSAMWTWGYVQPTLATMTRTCAYDRGGYGFSDPGPIPRTATVIATELHTMLERANIAPPYVLVGHSLGGYHVRMFADLYPDAVVGLVLIDPATTADDPILDSIPSVRASEVADDKRRNMCLALTEQYRFDSPSWKQCVESDPRYTPEMSPEGKKRRGGRDIGTTLTRKLFRVRPTLLSCVPLAWGTLASHSWCLRLATPGKLTSWELHQRRFLNCAKPLQRHTRRWPTNRSSALAALFRIRPTSFRLIGRKSFSTPYALY